MRSSLSLLDINPLSGRQSEDLPILETAISTLWVPSASQRFYMFVKSGFPTFSLGGQSLWHPIQEDIAKSKIMKLHPRLSSETREFQALHLHLRLTLSYGVW